ncbi:MAG: ABC transporter ATP-binding protein [SAR324 cluster bacterium]|nr:ABC transporter ATP-binding protein [SAR324 cluster bacterium]
MLRIRNLSVYFQTIKGTFAAVNNFDLDLKQGEIVSIVGESGSGKSVCMLALMGLLSKNSIIKYDEISFEGKNILQLKDSQRRSYLGAKMSMIFQEPISSLNPCFRVGDQVAEVFRFHQGDSKKAAQDKTIDLFTQVGIADAKHRYRDYPHQLSGGMNQRVMIAMAIALKPKVLIADEPTTALDVTIQAQILNLLNDIRDKYNMALILITHDMGVVAMMADRVVTLYRGQQVEISDKEQLFSNPKHPYTVDLLASLPEEAKGKRLNSITGVIPPLHEIFTGCIYAPRCKFAVPECQKPIKMKSAGKNHLYRCIR